MADQLKILHSENSMGWGGQELRVLSESRGLLERGHDVLIVCPPDSGIRRGAERMRVPAIELPIGRRSYTALRCVVQFLRQHDCDIINTHSSTDSWLFATAAKVARHRAALVRTRHISSHVSRDPLTYWVYRYGVQRVVTTGEALRRQLVHDNRLPEKHVVSVPTGIDTDRFVPGDKLQSRERLGLPKDRLIVGIVATIRHLKGHADLVEAAAMLDRSIRWLIVGDGPSRGVVESRIASLGLESSFLLAGNQDDVVPWLQAMDLFVLPTYAEGVPQSVMQASSCGLPVLTTRVGGIPEIVRDNETGRLIEPGDVPLLAKSIAEILSDSELRQRWGARGRTTAIAHFGAENMITAMENVFRDVQSRRRGLAA